MEIILNLSNYFVPVFILLVMYMGIKEKVNVFDTFIEGAHEGIKIIIGLVPTLIGIIFSVELLGASNLIELLSRLLNPIFKCFNFPPEILPLALVRPISGSASIGVATELMKKYGVDSFIGVVASVIMGATETTLYTIAIYTGELKVKKSKKILLAALCADIAGMIAAVVFCRILSTSFP